jgi:hypothetical protein
MGIYVRVKCQAYEAGVNDEKGVFKTSKKQLGTEAAFDYIKRQQKSGLDMF